jgi:hypothetical protein
LGIIFELAQFLLQTCISNKQLPGHARRPNRGTTSNFATTNKTLTSADLCGPLLNGRHLVLDHDQLLFEGLLDPSGACKDSRS